MKKKKTDKYWENESCETIKFGNNFIRCYDKAGKLQFGKVFMDPKDDEEKYSVRFVLDRDTLFNSKEGYEFLAQTLEDWKEIFESDDYE